LTGLEITPAVLRPGRTVEVERAAHSIVSSCCMSLGNRDRGNSSLRPCETGGLSSRLAV